MNDDEIRRELSRLMNGCLIRVDGRYYATPTGVTVIQRFCDENGIVCKVAIVDGRYDLQEL